MPVNDFKVGDVVYFWTDGVGAGRGGWQGPAHVTDVAVAKDEVRLQYGHLWVNRASSQVRPVGSLGRSPARQPTPGGAPTPAPPLESAGVPAEDLGAEDGDTESVASSSSSLAERTASMMTGVQSALDRIASETVSERRVGVPPATAWTGRTRGASRPVHFATARDTTPDGAAGGAFEPLVTSPKQADEDFAVKRFGFQRGAIRRRFSGASTLDARRRKIEDALMAAFSGPDSLAAALRRTGVWGDVVVERGLDGARALLRPDVRASRLSSGVRTWGDVSVTWPSTDTFARRVEREPLRAVLAELREREKVRKYASSLPAAPRPDAFTPLVWEVFGRMGPLTATWLREALGTPGGSMIRRSFLTAASVALWRSNARAVDAGYASSFVTGDPPVNSAEGRTRSGVDSVNSVSISD